MKQPIIICLSFALTYTLYGMESDYSINLEHLKNLPQDLQKIILIQTKQTDENQYNSSRDQFITFQAAKNPKNPPSIPWHFESIQKNSLLLNKLLLKKPISFGPAHLLVCKKLLQEKTAKYFNGETNIYELYDTNTETIYDTLDFPTLITQCKIIPKDILQKGVQSSYFSKKENSFAQDFFRNPEYEVDQFRVDYFPELKNSILFSFSLNFCLENTVYKTQRPFYFALYDIEKKLLHYLGCSKSQVTRSLSTNQPSMHQISGSQDKIITRENHLFIEKIKPENMLTQLYALTLITCAWNWLEKENPYLQEGQEILRLFKNAEYIPNMYKLIWQTTTPEHGNIFKKAYEKVKKLKKMA